MHISRTSPEPLAVLAPDLGRTDCPCDGDLNGDNVVNEKDLHYSAPDPGGGIVCSKPINWFLGGSLYIELSSVYFLMT